MRYIEILQDLVDSYNRSKHRSIQKKPINVTQKNEREVWHTLYGEREKKEPVKYKFEVGDQVRISKMKRTFEKGYLPNFSKEIFTVSQQIPRHPPVYKLKDYDQEELSGTFVRADFQRGWTPSIPNRKSVIRHPSPVTLEGGYSKNTKSQGGSSSQ